MGVGGVTVALRGDASQEEVRFAVGTVHATRRFHLPIHPGEPGHMFIRRCVKAFSLACSMALVAGCGTSTPPAPLVRHAPYLYSDVIGGHKARAAKMKAAKIHAVTDGPTYMAELDAELRRQT